MTQTRLRRPAICLTCEDVIEAGDVAHHEHGVGAWHHDCPPPRNLALYRRERERGARRSRQYLDRDDC